MGLGEGVPWERLQGYIDGSFSLPRLAVAESQVADGIGRGVSVFDMRVVRAVAACMTGTPPERIARHLHWAEFESFSADLLRAKGYRVTENLALTEPRAQVDILARSQRFSLAVDCKRWLRQMNPASIKLVAEAQSKRAELMRQKMPHLEPICSVVLLMANEEPRFVGGAAVVPVHALGDFLENLDGLSERLVFH